MNISLRKLLNCEKDFIKIYQWCQKEFVYEWFEQRKLSLKEITIKYKKKLKDSKQDLFIIQCDNKDIGLVQIYKYEKDIKLDNLKEYLNIYEYDLFIGEEKYLSKGIGSIAINLINNMIYSKYKAEAIILRPFKRNIRAIKCYEKNGFKEIYEYNGTDTIGNKEKILVLINEKDTNH